MDREEKRILEVRTEAGELLFRCKITLKSEPDPRPVKETKQPEQRKGGNGGGNGEKRAVIDGGPYPLMTDAQKRYLFRLLASEGIEGEAAYSELKKTFNVNDLRNVTKLEASQEIEKRLAARKGGAADVAA